jgi:hypothetical protein
MAKATEPAFSPLSLAAMFCVPAKCYADFEAAAIDHHGTLQEVDRRSLP